MKKSEPEEIWNYDPRRKLLFRKVREFSEHNLGAGKGEVSTVTEQVWDEKAVLAIFNSLKRQRAELEAAIHSAKGVIDASADLEKDEELERFMRLFEKRDAFVKAEQARERLGGLKKDLLKVNRELTMLRKAVGKHLKLE